MMNLYSYIFFIATCLSFILLGIQCKINPNVVATLSISTSFQNSQSGYLGNNELYGLFYLETQTGSNITLIDLETFTVANSLYLDKFNPLSVVWTNDTNFIATGLWVANNKIVSNSIMEIMIISNQLITLRQSILPSQNIFNPYRTGSISAITDNSLYLYATFQNSQGNALWGSVFQFDLISFTLTTVIDNVANKIKHGIQSNDILDMLTTENGIYLCFESDFQDPGIMGLALFDFNYNLVKTNTYVWDWEVNQFATNTTFGFTTSYPYGVSDYSLSVNLFNLNTMQIVQSFKTQLQLISNDRRRSHAVGNNIFVVGGMPNSALTIAQIPVAGNEIQTNQISTINPSGTYDYFVTSEAIYVFIYKQIQKYSYV